VRKLFDEAEEESPVAALPELTKSAGVLGQLCKVVLDLPAVSAD
jgi:hypothetical protein